MPKIVCRALLVSLIGLIGISPKAVLLDTTQQNSLGWTKYPDGQSRMPGWVEESFTNFERGINWRSFVVCDVAFNSVNNWLWTPFIERGDANRLYIEIKFTMRDCNLFPQMVLSCKETFALLYKEMDAPIGAQQQQLQQQSASNASFAQSDSYTLIDAIAADEGRFTSNSDVVINTEIRSIPVSKRGVYFAFRDQGACLSLISIKVYHSSCPQLTTGFAHFNTTPTGRDLTSLVAVEGQCVPNSMQIEQPKMFCTADGQWNSMSSGQCKCLPGYEPAANQTRCLACPPGKFKASLSSELACQTCPERSSSQQAAASECKCQDGFYRAAKDSRSAPCTQPPGPPSNLSAIYVDSTSVVLLWQAPRYTGGRDDLTYKLLCDNCDPNTMVSSPQFYANFSETKCVLSGLQPSQTYRFVVYSSNGVSHLSGGAQAAQYSEISVQTQRQPPQTTSNTLSAQGGFQLTPIYNFRALPGARGTDMLLAWDAQPLGSSQSGAEAPAQSSLLLDSSQEMPLMPSLYEIRYQPRYTPELTRRSPYPLVDQQLANNQPTSGNSQQQPLSVTTTNRAVAITTLLPRTEYAFQIRSKWAHSSQWGEFSEPIYMATTNQMPLASFSQQDYLAPNSDQTLTNPLDQRQLPSSFLQQPPQPASNQSSAGGWLATLLLVLFCMLSVAFISVGLIHYRKSAHCLQSLGVSGFGSLGASAGGSSTYGGVYGGGVAGPLGSIFGNGASPLHHHAHHHANLSAGSAGGLITGSNATSRSSSGAGNVVQNLIAATLGQIGGGNHHAQHQHYNNKHSVVGSALTMGAHMANADGKLFATNQQQQQQSINLQRNHYHQTLSNLGHHHHTMLLATANGNSQQQRFQQATQVVNASGQPAGDLFKYRTLSQPGAQFGQQQQQQLDPQLHIYDDLDNTTCESSQATRQYEINPQRVTIESVIGRGEFGDVCLALLRSPITETETRVAVKTLKAQANDKAKLDFLVEASIMSQFEHPNIIRLEGVVTKSEPPMIVTEFMENGSLDAYLRDNKNRFTCMQLISMLRGIANGMQYLAKLNYVHKDLAARNILVSGQNVCKIADFGLSAHQPSGQQPTATNQADQPTNDYTNDSTSTNSSNHTLSSQTTGSTPTTASTLATGSSNLTQLQTVADQLAQQRFAVQQQQQQPAPSAPIQSIQNLKIPVRWTALEAIAFRRFTSASDVWSFGIVCWEVMTEGERPYWNWSNQDVIKAVEQGYRLPRPESCPEQLYQLMLDCWLKDRAARPTFGQILKSLDRLLSPYDDPFSQPMQSTNALGSMMSPQQQQQQLAQLVPMHTRIPSNHQEPAYYDTCNPISQLISTGGNGKSTTNQMSDQIQQSLSVEDWLNSIKMSRYRENFQRHQINSLQYVARLSQADLNLIGIQNGQHLKKILTAITSLRSTTSIGACGEGYLV